MNRDNLVVILAYNEEDRIAETISAFRKHPVIVVVDGDDRTAAIARSKSVTVLEAPSKRGYGVAVSDGLRYACAHGYKYATIVDVGTCDPQDLLDNYTGCDLLIRARRFRLTNWRTALSLMALLLVSIFTGRIIPDATFGYRTYRLEKVIPLLAFAETNGYASNLELFLLSITNGLSVTYQEVAYMSDNNGSLSARDIMVAIRCLIRLCVLERGNVESFRM